MVLTQGQSLTPNNPVAPIGFFAERCDMIELAGLSKEVLFAVGLAATLGAVAAILRAATALLRELRQWRKSSNRRPSKH